MKKYILCVSYGNNVLGTCNPKYDKILTSMNQKLERGSVYLCKIKDISNVKGVGEIPIVIPVKKISSEPSFKEVLEISKFLYNDEKFDSVDFVDGTLKISIPVVDNYPSSLYPYKPKRKNFEFTSSLWGSSIDNLYYKTFNVLYDLRLSYKKNNVNFIRNWFLNELEKVNTYLKVNAEKPDIVKQKIKKEKIFKTEEEAKKSGLEYKKIEKGHHTLPDPTKYVSHIFSEYKTEERHCTREEIKKYNESYVIDSIYWKTIKPVETGEYREIINCKYYVKQYKNILEEILSLTDAEIMGTFKRVE